MYTGLGSLWWYCVLHIVAHEPCLAGASHVILLHWQQLVAAYLWLAVAEDLQTTLGDRVLSRCNISMQCYRPS